MSRFRNAVLKLNSKASISVAAWMLASATLLSSALGFLRERLLNAAYMPNEVAGTLGHPVSIDAYTVAFTVPDFMYVILVSGALSVTFIPVFNQRLAAGNPKSAWQLSSSLINFMALLTFIASVLIIIFADPLVRYVVGPGLSEEGHGLAVSMMRVIAVNPFLFAVATILVSMQQAVGRFTFYAMAPVVYNLGIISGILFFTKGITIFGVTVFEGGIMGVALGVALGSILNLIISAIGLIGFGFDYQFKIFIKNKGFRQVLRLLPPRSLDQGADYLNNIVEINLASRMPAGSVRSFQQASMLHLVPVSFIGNAISTAAFPNLTSRLAQGRPDLFKKDLQSALRIIIWLSLPITTITFFARGYLVSFIISGGDTLIAALLGILAAAILFRSIYHIAARSFYAQQDTKTPLYVSIFSIALNIILAVWFTMNLRMGVYGLAWAETIVSILEVIILLTIMGRRLTGLYDAVFQSGIVKMISATGFMAVITYLTVRLMPLAVSDQRITLAFPKFIIITVVSFSFYILFSWLIKLEEVNPIIARAKKILFSQIG